MEVSKALAMDCVGGISYWLILNHYLHGVFVVCICQATAIGSHQYCVPQAALNGCCSASLFTRGGLSVTDLNWPPRRVPRYPLSHLRVVLRCVDLEQWGFAPNGL